ncbi:hypothetical protein [Spirulina subsalsa]|uniref:hypothetical protein n=1 Tax=Spirulina subsalsa TaxID=54311 RepID=UPI0002E2F3C1|nr:hypothetical protein [Spirulina subsalsa]
MQKTALNLLAIGIFGITLSILLGPIIHLPSTVPAILTLGVLGLATIDTLGLHSKGTTLLLDTVAGLSPKHRQRIAHHEAAHFLTAYYLGIPITQYTLNSWDALKQGLPGIGGVQFDTTSFEQKNLSYPEQQLLLNRFITVWMAGITAEILIYGDVEGGGDDRQKITDALVLFGYGESVSASKQQWGKLQAKTLLEKYWDSYLALVEAMLQGVAVDQCYVILDQGNR